MVEKNVVIVDCVKFRNRCTKQSILQRFENLGWEPSN